jgi:ABC-type transport system substrate-binding protein
VKFHNGKSLAAADIEFSWDRCRNEIADKGRCKGELNDVVSFEATGDYGFTVVLTNENPVFIPSIWPIVRWPS